MREPEKQTKEKEEAENQRDKKREGVRVHSAQKASEPK